MNELQALPVPGLNLVFGASGYVGSNLVERLLKEGRPRAAARNLKVLQAREWQGAELAQADALAPETLPAALAGVQIAYYLVHSMAAGRNFGDLDLQAARHFADAAAAAGVQRIVYLGGLVPKGTDSEHLVSRRRTGEVLRDGPVPVTELRAGIIVGAGSAALTSECARPGEPRAVDGDPALGQQPFFTAGAGQPADLPGQLPLLPESAGASTTRAGPSTSPTWT